MTWDIQIIPKYSCIFFQSINQFIQFRVLLPWLETKIWFKNKMLEGISMYALKYSCKVSTLCKTMRSLSACICYLWLMSSFLANSIVNFCCKTRCWTKVKWLESASRECWREKVERVKDEREFVWRVAHRLWAQRIKDGQKWQEKDIAHRWATDPLSPKPSLVLWRIHAASNNKSQSEFNLMSCPTL